MLLLQSFNMQPYNKVKFSNYRLMWSHLESMFAEEGDEFSLYTEDQ